MAEHGSGRPYPTSVNTSLTHELVFVRDKTSLTVPTCPSGTRAEVTGRRMTSKQRSAGLFTEAVGSLRNPFDAPLMSVSANCQRCLVSLGVNDVLSCDL